MVKFNSSTTLSQVYNIFQAYNTLRNRIPNVPADTKLSKIKTLRYATNYIKYLDSILKGEISSTTDFNPTNCAWKYIKIKTDSIFNGISLCLLGTFHFIY